MLAHVAIGESNPSGSNEFSHQVHTLCTLSAFSVLKASLTRSFLPSFLFDVAQPTSRQHSLPNNNVWRTPNKSVLVKSQKSRGLPLSIPSE